MVAVSDIRVIKTICALSEAKDGFQKELNIVSVDGGPFAYDIRDWRLDHFDYRDGISLDEKEAAQLLISLRQSFGLKDSDLDVQQIPMPIEEQIPMSVADQIPMPVVEQVSMPIAEQIPMPVAEQISLPLAEQAVMETDVQKTDIGDILKEKGISFIDKRERGGALWVIGGHELDALMEELKGMGFRFWFSKKGGRVSKNQPAWFIAK